MKKLLVLLILLAGIPCLMSAGILRTKYADLVNPFVGTDFHGHTFPGAAYPFGMIQLSPDTREDNWDGCSGYHYSDPYIKGFSHTHLSGTGCADLCDIRVMPVSGYSGPVEESKYQSEFFHGSEKASPGYYTVYLERWNVKAELTVGRRAGVHRYTYSKGAVPQMVIDLDPRDQVLDSKLEQVGDHAVQGFRRSRSWADDQIVYFYMEFSRPITGIVAENTTGGSKGARALLTFGAASGRSRERELIVRVGISSVSASNARANLESESNWKTNGIYSFDVLKEMTRRDWNNFLSKIEVEGDKEAMRVFYTALYHAAIAPSLYSDVNGEYRGMDRKIHRAEGFERYHIFSLWDTYRALHPLFNLIERKRSVDFIKTMLSIYDEAGKLPIWELSGNETDCMIGYSSAPVIADAVAKGITDFDIKKALEAMVASSTRPEYGIDSYMQNGLVLADQEHESVSKTLEYAVDDWCIAQVAGYLHDPIVEATYLRRAQNWRNLYDPGTGFMRPRVNGILVDPFNPSEVNVHYTEANSWQYSFHVQHDVNGLIDLCGGDTSLEEWLDELFAASSETSGGWKVADMTGMIGQYAHGNEPSHHIAYLYAYAGVPWKTQKLVRQIMDELYTSKPDGLCGNEDCGQMSAWYVFSALGFYPVTPGGDCYVLGSPIFRNAVIHLENGNDFTVRAPRNSGTRRYIDHVMRDGSPYDKSYIPATDILQGSTYVFGMNDRPNREFGAREADRPVAECDDMIVENPWFIVESPVFNAFTRVEIGAMDKDYQIWYKIIPEGTTPLVPYELYERPFTISRNATVFAYCLDKEGNRSFDTKTTLRQTGNDYKVTLAHPYSPVYSGGGDNAIVDGIRGTSNFRLGGWQGFQGCDLEAVIDLGEEKTLSRISAGFLQSTGSWIVLPRWVEFYTSEDGETFTQQCHQTHDVDPQDYTSQIHEFTQPVSVKARYVKVVAKSFGELPAWHLGAGGQSHIFIDEVTVN
ncbi:MAG: GH92 family glycosyl hydrolase [Bacteroidales bacterium]|nr:GH92 family glycosyl hydrolase [Bacteroidales bacterium]